MSQDLKYFAHEHPVLDKSGEFHFEWKFPEPGMYRVLTDYYPKGATPQLNTNTLFVAGGPPVAQTPVKLMPDLSPQKSENLTASLTMDPPQAVAGFKTLMFFDLNPGDHERVLAFGNLNHSLRRGQHRLGGRNRYDLLG